MGEYNAYQDYERRKNEPEVSADIYGRINTASLENYDDDSGEFVAKQRFNNEDKKAQARSQRLSGTRASEPVRKPSRPGRRRSTTSVDGVMIVDIVCILITVVGVVLVGLNFLAVLDAIIQVIFPIIEVVILVILLALLGAVAWVLLRRRFSRFRF